MVTDPKVLAGLQYGPQAAFLGVDPSELAGLTPAEIEKKVNDKLSLYEQKPMGYGTQDRYTDTFRQQTLQLNQSLQQVDRAVTSATDRRQAIPTQPQPPAPDLNRMIRSNMGSMEDRIVAKVFRQLQRSFA